MRRVARWFLLGALVGTLGDRVHTYFHVLSYPRDTVFDEPWWVLLEFGLAGVALFGSSAWVRARVGEPRGGSRREVVVAALWVAGIYLASGVFRRYEHALAVFFVSTFVGRALSAPRSRAAWLHALGAAVVGPIAEALISRAGAFHYLRMSAVVPVWLPGLYLHVALLARALERREADAVPAAT